MKQKVTGNAVIAAAQLFSQPYHQLKPALWGSIT